MPKPASKTAYTYFVEDFIQEQAAKGIVISHKDGYLEASRDWAKLPEIEKQEYKRMAQGKKVEKFNTHGISLRFIANRQAEMEAWDARETLEIDQVVDDGVKANTIFEENFFVINTKYYCLLNDGNYLTCEVAVVSFNLKSGVGEEQYHRLINVGSIPTGYTLEARNNARENGIPMPPIESGEEDMLRILAEIIAFVEPQKRPLYTFVQKTKHVTNFLAQLCDNANEDRETFKVYSLPKLFYKLRNSFTSDSDRGFPASSIPVTQLEKDHFTYTKGIGCEMHEEGEQFYKCALSEVKRWCFIVCDHCCEPAGMTLKPGRHVPQKAHIEEIIFEEASYMQPRSSPRRPGPTVRDFKEEQKPQVNEEPGTSRPYISPAWERPQVVERACPTPEIAEASSVAQEQWPSLGDSRRRPGRGGRR